MYVCILYVIKTLLGKGLPYGFGTEENKIGNKGERIQRVHIASMKYMCSTLKDIKFIISEGYGMAVCAEMAANAFC